MGIFVGGMRGLGSSLTPMVITIFGVCALRVVWVYTVFAVWPLWEVLFLSYPVTWVITALIGWPCYMIIKKNAMKRLELAKEGQGA